MTVSFYRLRMLTSEKRLKKMIKELKRKYEIESKSIEKLYYSDVLTKKLTRKVNRVTRMIERLAKEITQMKERMICETEKKEEICETAKEEEVCETAEEEVCETAKGKEVCETAEEEVCETAKVEEVCETAKGKEVCETAKGQEIWKAEKKETVWEEKVRLADLEKKVCKGEPYPGLDGVDRDALAKLPKDFKFHTPASVVRVFSRPGRFFLPRPVIPSLEIALYLYNLNNPGANFKFLEIKCGGLIMKVPYTGHFHHFNFWAFADDDSSKKQLFFAEGQYTNKTPNYQVTFCCPLDTSKAHTDNCKGCVMVGSSHVLHPDSGFFAQHPGYNPYRFRYY